MNSPLSPIHHSMEHSFALSPSSNNNISLYEDNDNNASSPRGVDNLKDRLLTAQKTIKECTETALRAASFDMTLPGINLDQFPTSSNSSEETQDDKYSMWLRPPITSKELLERGISIFEENDFNGGMEYMIHERLQQVESDLLDIVKFHNPSKTSPDGNNISMEYANNDHAEPNSKKTEKENDNDDGDESFMDIDNLQVEGNENNAMPNISKEELQLLIFKVRFLRKCANARNKLDECAYSNDIVNSAKCMEEAENIHKECHDMIQSYSKSNEEEQQQNHQADGPTMQIQESIRRDLQISNHILGSIFSQIIRQRSSLHSQASSIFDDCISIQTNKIAVKNAPLKCGPEKHITSIEAAFQVFKALSKHNENTLTDVICILTSKLYKEVFLKILQKKHPHSKSCATKKDSNSKAAFPRYSFEEHTFDENVSISDLQDETVKVKTLEWEQDSALTQNENNANVVDSAAIFVEPWSHILGTLTRILDFVHDNVLLEQKELCNMVGDILFIGNLSTSSAFLGGMATIESLASMNSSSDPQISGPLAQKLLDLSWDSFIPEVPSEIDNVGTILLRASQTFETNLINKSFISQAWLDEKKKGEGTDSSNNILPLSNFASLLEHNFGEKRRSEILIEGRKILLNEDFHNTTIVGTDADESEDESLSIPTIERVMEKDGQAVFLLHKCAISKVASSIMNLARKALDASINPNSLVSTGPQFYRAARELFDLYRAIIPTLHSTALSSIPRAAAIFHNDCIYFAHVMLTLGHEYREQYPPESHIVLRKMCTFVDLVPMFRELGDRVLVDMIERQKKQLANLVYERVNGLRNSIRMNEEVVEWSEAQTGARAANYHLRHLSTAWINILSRDIFGRVMGNLVDTLLTIILNQVMGANEISAAASHFVGTLFSDAMKTNEIFPGKIDEAKKFCNLWEKFEVVGKFMDMSLVQINTALSEGYFRSVTGPELSGLIRATFDDSEKRRSLLSALANE